MIEVNWATPLYEFLRQCNAVRLPREVLDCGAGGSNPPLSIFHQSGYRTCGIEIAQEALLEAQQFCAENQMALNIIRGDMRRIPFPKECFSFVYSYNAIDFMTKPDIDLSIKEITRVLRQGGLCYLNFLSVDDEESWEPFCKTADAMELLGSTEFSHFEDSEADAYFQSYKILRKEKLFIDKLWKGRRLRQADIAYTAMKS